MKTINKVLIAVIVIMVAIIGYEGYSFYSDNYAIENIKPYVDPYKSYSRTQLKEMMDKGDLDATAEYGRLLMYEDKDTEAAFRLFMKAANAGNARGENLVGNYYDYKKNYGEAYKWYSKAADQKCLYAIANLGNLYRLGHGVKEDKDKAFSLYEEAAKKGLANAQQMIGFCYQDGCGVSKNEKMAFKWYKKAAESDCPMAYYSVAFCYESGTGVEKDGNAAAAWYEKAANKGNDWGIYGLGTCYRDGTGVAKDQKKAHALFSKAAGKGNCAAQYEIAREYENTNPTQAFEWYMKAAKQDHSPSQVALSLCYLNGTGVARNFDTARYWMELAAKQGYQEAKDKLSNWNKTIQEIRTQEENQKRAEEEYQRKYGHLGTFEFTDKQGHEWVLTVNNDETATIKTKEGTLAAYASWYRYEHMKHAQFRCSDRAPMICFPGSELYIHDNGFIGAESCGSFCIDGKYIYYNSSAADAKNPDLRLPLKKIK